MNETDYYFESNINLLNSTNSNDSVSHLPWWSNITLDEYLLINRGPKYSPKKIVIPITLIYGALFITGVIGNLIVCIVIASNNTMHTPTNYYLFSLAMSDLALLLLGLPNDLSVYWQQYPWALGLFFCKFRAVVSEMSSYVSVLTIVAFSLERYIAICHPLTTLKTDNLQRVIKLITSLWFLSLISATPFAIYTTVNYLDYPPGSEIPINESAFCAMLKENIPTNLPIYELSSFIFFILPAIILTIIYIKIVKSLRNNKPINGRIHGELRSTQSRKSIVAMLMAVVIAFFICWAPFHLQRLMYVYMNEHPAFHVINMWMYYITGILYYLSATINPILYNLMSIRYRTAFKQTICCIKPEYFNNAVLRSSSIRNASSNNNNNYANNNNRISFTQNLQLINNGEGDDLETQI